jgi:CRP-like cAMP-binding protein
MAIDALVKPLLSLPLFRDLQPLQLTEIVRRAERIIYRAGDVIAAEDRLSDAAILIVSGNCVRLTGSGNHFQEDVLPEGSLVSELAMLVEIAHPATILAQTQVKALRLSRDKMRELMTEDVSLARHFSSHILKRLQLLAEELNSVDGLLAKRTNAIAPKIISTPARPHQPAQRPMH